MYQMIGGILTYKAVEIKMQLKACASLVRRYFVLKGERTGGAISSENTSTSIVKSKILESYFP